VTAAKNTRYLAQVLMITSELEARSAANDGQIGRLSDGLKDLFGYTV
jgi:hypothetical protein